MRTPSTVGRLLVRTGVCLFLMLLSAVAYLHVVGAPRSVVDRLLAMASSRVFSIEADTLRLNLTGGLTADSVRVYRKRVAAPAALVARRVHVSIDALALVKREACVRKIRIEHAEFRPEWTAGPPVSTGPDDQAERTDGPPPTRIVLTVADCRLKEVSIDALRCELTIQKGSWRADELDAKLSRDGVSGFVRGHCHYRDDGHLLRAHVDIGLDPGVLLPWFDGFDMPETADLVRRFAIGQSGLRCEADFIRVCRPGGRFDAKGLIQGEHLAYRGIHVDSARSQIRIHNEAGQGTVHLAPLVIVRPEGTARMDLFFDGGRHETAFSGESSIAPKVLTELIGILTKGELDDFHFEGPAHITADGRVKADDPSASDVAVTVTGERVRFKRLYADDYSFGVRVLGPTNRIEDFKGTLAGGTLTGTAAFFRDPAGQTNTGYELSMKVEDADCLQLVQDLGDSTESHFRGRLFGHLDVAGVAGTNLLRTTTGRGRMDIRGGKVFALPLFGGFSDIMMKIIPGLDFVLVQSDAVTEFTVAEGKLRSERIDVKGDVLSLTGYGEYAFDDTLDVYARLTLMKEHTLVAKLIAPLVYPISKLFEFRLQGTLREPKWYPVNFSKDMLEKIGLRKKE